MDQYFLTDQQQHQIRNRLRHKNNVLESPPNHPWVGKGSPLEAPIHRGDRGRPGTCLATEVPENIDGLS